MYDKIAKTIAENKVVPEVLLYDADFACYECADIDLPMSQIVKRVLAKAETLRKMSGAKTVRLYLTLGEKSGRDLIATVKPYQENRGEANERRLLAREVRTALVHTKVTSNHIEVVPCYFFEADDVMSRDHVAFNEHDQYRSCICSGDKDLKINHGLHMNSEGEITRVPTTFGFTGYKEVGNVKPKLIGYGTSYFWHQMIMGDTADNIPGLPELAPATADYFMPLKSGKPRKKNIKCGEAKAVIMLKNVKTDKLAAGVVYDAYTRLYGAEATARFMEQAYLLWMQQTPDVFDVEVFLQFNCGLAGARFTDKQRTILYKWVAKIKEGKEHEVYYPN